MRWKRPLVSKVGRLRCCCLLDHSNSCSVNSRWKVCLTAMWQAIQCPNECCRLNPESHETALSQCIYNLAGLTCTYLERQKGPLARSWDTVLVWSYPLQVEATGQSQMQSITIKIHLTLFDLHAPTGGCVGHALLVFRLFTCEPCCRTLKDQPNTLFVFSKPVPCRSQGTVWT
jgi:hypothetical protein